MADGSGRYGLRMLRKGLMDARQKNTDDWLVQWRIYGVFI